MITVITGNLGEGKTLLMTYLAQKKYLKNKVKIYANYHLNKIYFPNYTYIKSLDDILKVRDGLVLLDELWSWIDCRCAKTARNRFLTSLFLRSRKRGWDILATAQIFGTLDIRFREITDFIIRPSLRCFVLSGGQHIPLICKASFYHKASLYELNPKPFRTLRFFTLPAFSMYNTNEEVEDIEND